MRKNIAAEILAFVFVFIFLFVALSKLFDIKLFVYDIGRMPYLAPYAGDLAHALPIMQIMIAVLLFLPATRLIGYWAALVMLLVYAVYVGILLFTVSGLPCTCGAFIRDVSWKNHFYIYIGLSVLAIWGMRLQKKQWRRIAELDHLNLT